MRALAGLVLAAALAAVAADPALGVDFATPTVVSNFHPGFEPDAAIDGAGQIYSSTPFGFSTTQSFIFRSNDGGQSFHLAEGNFLGKPATCIGGCEIYLLTQPLDNQNFISDLLK